MDWTINSTDRNWLELADILRREWQGAPFDRQRALELARQVRPGYPDMRHTLAHLGVRPDGVRH